MQLVSLPKFFIGHRQAIIDIAGSRCALLVGFMFVISAGLAREYDAEYLLKEPWHALIPLCASVLASLSFFLIAYGIGKRRSIGPVGFFRPYLSFLALFWMTAPLAWLYGIPFERMTDAIGSTKANLGILQVISIWRVLLMTRVVSVFFGCRLLPAFCCVMLVAAITMMAALAYAPLPIIQFMGGIRISESAALVANTAFAMQFWGMLTMPVWIIGALILASYRHPQWTMLNLEQRNQSTPAALWLAACSVAAWLVPMPWTQAEQRLRYEAESLLAAGQVHEGLAMMSRHPRNDFPPLWDPPPRPDYRIHDPDITEVMLSIINESPAPWVRDLFIDKFRAWLGIARPSAFRNWWRFKNERLETIVSILEQLPEGPQIASEMNIDGFRGDSGRALIERLKKLASRA